MKSKNVIVIGAGVAGLATSVRLAAKGYKVSVFEKSSKPGGKLHSFTLNGFRFDAGPSLFTMPQYVEELLKLNIKKDYNFKYVRLTTLCNYFFSNGNRFSAPSDKDKFVELASKVFNEESKNISKAFEYSSFIYKNTFKVFIESSLHKVSTYFKKGILRSIFSLPKLGTEITLNTYYSSLFKSKDLIQYFNRYATYNGSSPYKAPATLHIIPHIEHEFGAYLPEHGMVQITNTLFELAKDLGVQFNFSSSVDEIVVDKNKIAGIRVGENVVRADAVVSNVDVFYTYHKLLPHLKKPLKILSQEKSSSALIFYWGINKQFPELDLHNIFFSENYKEEFDAIFNNKTLYLDPTIYINITSKVVKDDAPANSENWFVMINVPANYGQNWSEIIETAKKSIISKLNRVLNEDIEKLIACERVLDPIRIDNETGSHLGSLYGYSSNNKMAAFKRHSNFHNSIKGLYFCGGSVHPGGGIPMCLMSAKIIDENFI